MKESPDSFRATKAQAGSLKRFLSKEVLNKETGEVLDSRKLLAMIDEKKLEEFTSLMGYYQIRTSEVDMDGREIISVKEASCLQGHEGMGLWIIGKACTESNAKMESDIHEG